MSSKGNRATKPTDESASLRAAGDLVESKRLVRLGEANDGRQICYDADCGEIHIRELDGPWYETVEKHELKSTIHVYRDWVDREADVDVEWVEEAFQ
jgi:hypothetical protein